MESMVFCKHHSGLHPSCIDCDEPYYLNGLGDMPYIVTAHLAPGTVMLDPTAPRNKPRVLCQSTADLHAVIDAMNTAENS